MKGLKKMNEFENYESEQEPRAKPEETKAERFERLALYRYTKAVERIRMLTPLANRNNYEYDRARVKNICDLLRAEIYQVEKAFEASSDERIINPFEVVADDV